MIPPNQAPRPIFGAKLWGGEGRSMESPISDLRCHVRDYTGHSRMNGVPTTTPSPVLSPVKPHISSTVLSYADYRTVTEFAGVGWLFSLYNIIGFQCRQTALKPIAASLLPYSGNLLSQTSKFQDTDPTVTAPCLWYLQNFTFNVSRRVTQQLPQEKKRHICGLFFLHRKK